MAVGQSGNCYLYSVALFAVAIALGAVRLQQQKVSTRLTL